MAEQEIVETVAEEETSTPAVKPTPAPDAGEKPGWLGQTPSMWFLIDTVIVLILVLIMRFTA